MFDPLLPLAISMYSNQGVYALLVGSGVSRAAGIPTGYEVIQDLILKLAALEDAKADPDPFAWFKSKYGVGPDYSSLLSGLAKSPSERTAILKPYFEPTKEEREQDLKVPTKAHYVIAGLVARGYVRVIVTTNFDRLLEHALEELGIVPNVISTPDAAEAAIPLIHAKCTVIKVHGDYVDTRLKNTQTELSAYDPKMDALLDQVCDQFGLIICGWSAEWDVALRHALERIKGRRYTIYWTFRSNPSGYATELIRIKDAQQIKIKDANSFFTDLDDKLTALRDYEQPHPLSSVLAVATIKRYLVQASERIRLNDLVRDETEKLHRELSSGRFPLNGVLSPEAADVRVRIYENLTEILAGILATGCFWSHDASHHMLWLRAVGRIANPELNLAGGWNDDLYKLALYPATLLVYASGITACSRGDFALLKSILFTPKRLVTGHTKPLMLFAHPRTSLNSVLSRPNIGTRASERVYEALKDLMREFFPSVSEYQDAFNRFEFITSLVQFDWTAQNNIAGGHALLGRFVRFYDGDRVDTAFLGEIEQLGSDWPPLKAGLFDGDSERAKRAIEGVRSLASQSNWSWGGA